MGPCSLHEGPPAMHIIADFAVWLQSRGWSDAWTFAFCFNATYVVVVWGLTLLFAAIDHWNLLDRWKIQKGKWPEAALHKEAFKEQALRTFTNFGVLGPVHVCADWPRAHVGAHGLVACFRGQ